MKCSVVRYPAVVRGLIACGYILPALYLVTPDVLPAQHTIAATESIAFEKRAQEILSRPVTVQLNNVSPADAVHAIAANAKVRIQYRLPLLDAVRAPVSLALEQMPLKDALHTVLAGSGLRIQVSGENLVTIMSGRHEIMPVQGTIAGKVISAKTKQPVAGATITVANDTSRAVTGVDGVFRIMLDAGTYEIKVRGVGFVQQVRQVTVEDGKSQTVEFVLEPSASVLDEVVVTGTVVATERRAIPNPITVITAEEIERRGIMRVEELLRGSVPGLIAVDQGSAVYDADDLTGMAASRMYSRGSASLNGDYNPIKTYVDGVELADPSYLGMIDPQSIERIEIITGPQAATVYGSGALGGVMQIFTKKGAGKNTPEIKLSLQYGVLQNNMSSGKTPMHNDVLNVQGGSGVEFTYSGNLSYAYSGQWQPNLFSRRLGAAIGAVYTRGGLRANGNVSIMAGRHGTAYTSTLASALSTSGEWRPSGALAPSPVRSNSSSQILSFSIDYQPTTYWHHQVTVGRNYTQFSHDPASPRFQRPVDSLFRVRQSAGGRTTLGYNTTMTLPATTGVTSVLTLGITGSTGNELSTDGCIASTSSTSWVGCVPWNYLSGNAQPVSVSQNATTESWGGFGRAQIGFFNRAFLTLGLRGERNPRYGRAHKIDWTPTNGLTYAMDIGDLTIKLLASYGRATRPPASEQRLEDVTINLAYDPSQWYSQLANPDLIPERARGPQGGVELYYGNLGSLTVNHYSQHVSDLIQYVPIDSIRTRNVNTDEIRWFKQYKYLNTASMRQYGWEGTTTINIGAFSVKGTYAWTETEILSLNPKILYPSYPVGRRSLAGVPTHTGNLTLSYARQATSMTLETNYMGQKVVTYLRGPYSPIVYERSNSRLPMYVNSVKMGTWNQIQPSYAKVNFTMSHRITSSAFATLNVKNIGNSYESESEFTWPTLGRQTLLGISFRFP